MASLLLRLYLSMAIICVHFLQVSGVGKCYQCYGLLCSKINSQVVDCPIGMCFMISVDVTNHYRGCFQSTEYFFNECKKNRFTRCRVCKGNLCNDWEVVDRTMEISCKRCETGVCTPKKDSMSFQKCPYFRFPESPRCYTILDRLTNMYTFGCANQMTLEQVKLCESDWFQSVCQYCDTPNCNNRFFRGSLVTALSCFVDSGKTSKQCSTIPNKFPYFGCYTAKMDELYPAYGCLQELFESPDDGTYQSLFTSNSLAGSLLVCFTDKCNTPFNNTMIGLTACGNLYCGTMLDNAAICAKYVYTDEQGEELVENKCLGRYPCWNSECQLRCLNTDSVAVIGQTCLTPTNFECFVCTDCPNVNLVSRSQRLVCTDSQTRTCVTILVEDTVIRGCLQGELKNKCDLAGIDCKRCHKGGCNSDVVSLYCHQCTPFNPMCMYEQQDTLALPCPDSLKRNINSTIVCYSGTTLGGKVQRGCVKQDDDCPAGVTDCEICDFNFCNRKSYISASCISCTGNFEEPCAESEDFLAGNVTLKTCPMGYETPHCYTILRYGKIDRGCVSDLDFYEIRRHTCNEFEDCLFCDFAENCNYQEVHLLLEGPRP